MSNFDAARLVMGNRRRGMLLSFRGYLFAKNRSRNDTTYWRCVESACSVMMHTNVFPQDPTANGNIVVKKEPPTHNHAACDASIARRDMIREMIDVVQADPCATVMSAYNNVTSKSQHAHLPESIPTFVAVESILRRRRSECFPDVPHQLSDVDISGEWAQTWSDKRHLSLLDNNWGLVIFMTKQNAKILLHCETIFVDGTFRTAPHPYVQMVTIHGLFRDVIVPLTFSLVSGKTTGQYRQIFSHISNQLTVMFHRRWSPVNIVCDFEVALTTALETELP
jgi:FLYWCH zinc finger domain/MULE transposase domain